MPAQVEPVGNLIGEYLILPIMQSSLYIHAQGRWYIKMNASSECR